MDEPHAESRAVKILLTGATGFVGKAMLPRLIADGHDVRCALRAANDMTGDSAVVGDIGPGTEWRAALDGIEAVVHLAGRAHVADEELAGAFAKFHDVNALGTQKLAVQAAAGGVKRFVLISSVKAAGEASGARPLTEQDRPAPRTPYGISKWEGEQALAEASKRMETVVLRPPLVYGPGVGANFLSLLRAVDGGLPLPFGAVRNRRSLIARDNLVDAIAVALTVLAAAGGTFYVSDGRALSTAGLIRALAEALDKPARLIPVPPVLLRLAARLMDYKDAAESVLGSLEIDDTAFRAATGWAPPVTQDAAFRAVAEWYRGRT